MDKAEFVQVWRSAWRELRQQHDLLKQLYEQVALNASTRPSVPVGNALDTQPGLSKQLQWVEAVETSQGARDAYATAVVMFVDDLLKRVYGAYKAVPGPEPLTVGLRGVPLHRLLKAAGNNVRHYQGWNKPWELASTKAEKDARRQVRRDVGVLAQALGHPQPVETKHLFVYATNMASAVVLEVGGSYDAFEDLIKDALMEMIRNINVVNDAWIQHELRAGHVGTGSP